MFPSDIFTCYYDQRRRRYFVLNYLPVYVLTTIWNCPTVKSEVSEQESTVSTIGAGGKFEINNQLVNNDNLLDVINWTIDRLITELLSSL
jgi:hypothetical protein